MYHDYIEVALANPFTARNRRGSHGDAKTRNLAKKAIR